LGRDLQSAVESELNLTGGLFACLSVRHDAGPFDDLGNETFVTCFCRVPNSNFVVASVGLPERSDE
jgi:hypothetical protein